MGVYIHISNIRYTMRELLITFCLKSKLYIIFNNYFFRCLRNILRLYLSLDVDEYFNSLFNTLSLLFTGDVCVFSSHLCYCICHEYAAQQQAALWFYEPYVIPSHLNCICPFSSLFYTSFRGLSILPALSHITDILPFSCSLAGFHTDPP